MNSEAGIKPLLSALRGERQTPVPFWYMRQAGRYLPEYRKLRAEAGDFLNLCYSPDLAVEVSLQPLRRYDMDGVILFSDILVVPDALGIGLRYVEGEGPQLDALGWRDPLPVYSREKFLAHLSPVFETLKGINAGAPANVTVIGFAGAPWTVATYMVEGHTSKHFNFIKRWAFSDPSSFEILIKRLTDATAMHLCKQIEAGADVVQIFESWAGLLPPKEFARWCVKPVEVITKRVKERFPEVPVIAFPRGAGVGYIGYADATGVDGLGVDYTLPATWIAKVLQPDVCIQGNLEPQILLVGGSVMKAAVREIKSALNNGPFVFNLGHGVLPQTPPEHVAELVQLVRED